MVLRSWLRKVRSSLLDRRWRCRGTRRPQPVVPARGAEVFEVRSYPTATVAATVTGGVLHIEGTKKADTITVEQTGDQLEIHNGKNVVQVKVGGASVNQVSMSQVRQIEINGLAGNDKIRLDGVSTAANINGGKGNDKITGGGGDDTLTGGLGKDVLNGGGGINTLVESGNVNFTLTDTRLTGNGTDTLSNITQAQLTGGRGNNKLNASAFSGSAILEGGGGKDTLKGGVTAFNTQNDDAATSQTGRGIAGDFAATTNSNWDGPTISQGHDVPLPQQNPDQPPDNWTPFGKPGEYGEETKVVLEKSLEIGKEIAKELLKKQREYRGVVFPGLPGLFLDLTDPTPTGIDAEGHDWDTINPYTIQWTKDQNTLDQLHREDNYWRNWEQELDLSNPGDFYNPTPDNDAQRTPGLYLTNSQHDAKFGYDENGNGRLDPGEPGYSSSNFNETQAGSYGENGVFGFSGSGGPYAGSVLFDNGSYFAGLGMPETGNAVENPLGDLGQIDDYNTGDFQNWGTINDPFTPNFFSNLGSTDNRSEPASPFGYLSENDVYNTGDFQNWGNSNEPFSPDFFSNMGSTSPSYPDGTYLGTQDDTRYYSGGYRLRVVDPNSIYQQPSNPDTDWGTSELSEDSGYGGSSSGELMQARQEAQNAYREAQRIYNLRYDY